VSDPAASGPSRRRFLGAAAGTVGALAAGGAGYGVAQATEASSSTIVQSGSDQVPFYGTYQAGIATPSQDRLAFAAFDVVSTDSQAVQEMLGSWAAAGAQLTQGLPISNAEGQPQSPPVDTGEALGLSASRLTVTVGFGASFFDDRLGLQHKRPAALADIPALPGDRLQPQLSNGDLCVQACSDDPVVAFHVIRNFARIGRGVVVMRWSQLGFGRTSSTSSDQATLRNLMGFKDGTNNLKAQDPSELNEFVWVGSETDQPWMRNGSYLVSRRIRMFIEDWDADYLADQENVFGRRKDTGAPLTGKAEFDTVNLTATVGGQLVIPAHAHIRLAAPSSNGGQKLLRRGFSYTTHTSSGLFAVPPGLTAAGDWYGKTLFS
jgi:deferrochelatase/peroxidase EfeB